MTLNSIIKRIKESSLAHKQIQNFYFGRPTDFLTDKTTLFASVFLQDNGGNIDLSLKTTTLSFRMYVLDLVNVSDESKENEQDVLSDTLSIALDLLAIFDHSSYTDWKISFSNSMEFVVERFDDMVAGVVVDLNIQYPFEKDVCAVPTDNPIT